MATIHKFEDLEIWQIARSFYRKMSVIAARLVEKKNGGLLIKSNQLRVQRWIILRKDLKEIAP